MTTDGIGVPKNINRSREGFSAGETIGSGVVEEHHDAVVTDEKEKVGKNAT